MNRFYVFLSILIISTIVLVSGVAASIFEQHSKFALCGMCAGIFGVSVGLDLVQIYRFIFWNSPNRKV